MHMQSASIVSEAIAIMKNCLQQDITIDSYIYNEIFIVLKVEDLTATK